MGPRGAKVYVAAPGEEVECWCEKILWTSKDWPYVIHQLWISVGDEAQAGQCGCQGVAMMLSARLVLSAIR
jgi:hypothetical protein